MGNFVVVLFLTIDRLMVNSFFSIYQFAIYSFALTVAMTAYTFVRAISKVLFPYLSGAPEEFRHKIHHLANPTIIISWAAILTLYFPFTNFIKFYLSDYISSLPIMQVLLCTVGFGALIQIIHVNYFKVYRKQRQYFVFGVASLFSALILNLLAFRIIGTLKSIAAATLVSFIIWYLLNEMSLKQISGKTNRQILKGVTIICSFLAAFFIASMLSDWFLYQMISYIILFLLITWIAFSLEVKDLVSIVRNFKVKKL